MIGVWSDRASGFLVVVALFSLASLGLPMVLTPLTWASWLRWPVPSATDGRDLATYFGRCLGAVISVLAVVVLANADDDGQQGVLFAILIGAFSLMIGVHAWGALRRIQPLSETLEIAVWALLLVLALLFYPS